jgi:tousled-like kinase
MQPPPVPSDEPQEQEEIFRLRAQKLKDREKILADEKEKLEREKSTLIRELKRSQDQLRSKFNNFPFLNQRYLLLQLLGKGGFSEVWNAFDLQELREVACKIHELNPQWSEEKKSNYMKHATREYEIQKKLSHPRIVRLIDVFEVSKDGFCTVLEHCDGGDLEQTLKERKTLPEREARSIIMQVFVGLKYLNERRERVKNKLLLVVLLLLN